MLLFLSGLVLQQRLFHLSTPMHPAGSATSPSPAQAEGEPELQVAQCDLQCAIQGPEESKATQQQQQLEEKAQDRGRKLARRLYCWPTSTNSAGFYLLWYRMHLSQTLDYNKTTKCIQLRGIHVL